MLKLLLAFLLAWAIPSNEQNTPHTPISPCPSLLTYEPQTDHESDRWYGKIDFPVASGLWPYMTITLDSKADLLVNYLGEVTTQDNIVYKITNPEPKKWTRRSLIRFYVKYDKHLEVPPKVQIIRVSGKQICNADNPVTTLNSVTTASDLSSEYTMVTAVPLRRSGFHLPSPSSIAEEECGKVTLSIPIPLVLNGAPTLEGQWPWHVAIYRTQGINLNYICGGTLVSKKHVITAAHCTTVADSNPFQKIDESTLSVYLGKHNLVTSVTGTQIALVDKITVHPEYKTRTFQRDLCILLLQKPIEYTPWVQPACLWPDNMVELKNIVGKRGTVVGWGNHNSGSLLLVMMPVVDQETCLSSNRDFFVRYTSDYTFCAGLRDGRSPCNGDSGGGMVFKLDDSWYLRGLVSIAHRIASLHESDQSCDSDQFIVFTDLAQFLPWIRENTAD